GHSRASPGWKCRSGCRYLVVADRFGDLRAQRGSFETQWSVVQPRFERTPVRNVRCQVGFLRARANPCNDDLMASAAKNLLARRNDEQTPMVVEPAPTQRRSLRVLVVEDRPDDEELVIMHLTRGGYDVTHERVETAAAMSGALDHGSWDI